MYRVWYWLDKELRMVTCGESEKEPVEKSIAEYAWNIIMAYYPSYQPYLEFIKRR